MEADSSGPNRLSELPFVYSSAKFVLTSNAEDWLSTRPEWFKLLAHAHARLFKLTLGIVRTFGS